MRTKRIIVALFSVFVLTFSGTWLSQRMAIATQDEDGDYRIIETEGDIPNIVQVIENEFENLVWTPGYIGHTLDLPYPLPFIPKEAFTTYLSDDTRVIVGWLANDKTRVGKKIIGNFVYLLDTPQPVTTFYLIYRNQMWTHREPLSSSEAVLGDYNSEIKWLYWKAWAWNEQQKL